MDMTGTNAKATVARQMSIFSSHTSLEFQPLNIKEIRFGVSAVTLPNIPEFDRLRAEMPQIQFPIISKIFRLKYVARHGDGNTMKTNEMF